MNMENYHCEMNEADDEQYVRKAWPDLNILRIYNVGYYQGTVYVIGYTDNTVLAGGYGYGSCSGCGAWGEGGEPASPNDLIDSGVFGKTLEETLKWLADEPCGNYQGLNGNDKAHLASEIRRAFVLAEASA